MKETSEVLLTHTISHPLLLEKEAEEIVKVEVEEDEDEDEEAEAEVIVMVNSYWRKKRRKRSSWWRSSWMRLKNRYPYLRV